MRVNGGDFDWTPGMLAKRSRRRISWVRSDCAGGLRDGDSRVRPDNGAIPHNDKMDLSDGVTLAAALMQVSARTSCHGALYVSGTLGEPIIRCSACEGRPVGRGATLEQAVADAMEKTLNRAATEREWQVKPVCWGADA